MSKNKGRRVFFEEIEELRNGYYVVYGPPGGYTRFASLALVFFKVVSKEDARRLMEVEAKEWIERYPVPVMVSASDDKDDVIHVGESIEDSHFTAWRTPDGQIEEHWRPLKDSELPSDALSIDYLLTVYEDVLYQTREEVRKQADDWARERLLQKRITMFGLVAWGVVAPITIIILEKRLAWAGRLATLYASYKAGKYAIQLFGLKKTSRREMEKRDKEQRMKEYYYHCKKNPEGFLRLKAENVTRDERERTARTVEKLKRNEG